MIVCHRGMVSLKPKYADKRIPLFIRNLESNEAKQLIAQKAAQFIQDGDVVMLDASTTVAYILPFLSTKQNILLITNGAKTALEAASLGIKTLCTGGEMTLESFSYIGHDAEKMLKSYHADIAFFSCRGLSEEGIITDNSIFENAIRNIMMENAKKKFLLCDKSKFGHTYLHTLCHKDKLSGIISN